MRIDDDALGYARSSKRLRIDDDALDYDVGVDMVIASPSEPEESYSWSLRGPVETEARSYFPETWLWDLLPLYEPFLVK